MLRARTQFNIIPERCEIVIDCRLVPGESVEDVMPQIERVLAPLKAELPAARITATAVFLDPSLAPRGDVFTSWANGVLAHFGDVTPRGVPYGTDASNYAAVGLPAIVLGPGDIAQAHTHDEWIEISQVEKAVEVYGALMSTRVAK